MPTKKRASDRRAETASSALTRDKRDAYPARSTLSLVASSLPAMNEAIKEELKTIGLFNFLLDRFEVSLQEYS